MRLSCVFIVACVCVVGKVYSFKTGAPASMCREMLPKHTGSSPQSSQPPYIITVEEDPSRTEGVVIVKVDGSTDFVGLLLQGRTGANGEIIGKFSNLENNLQTLDCDGKQSSAVTHADNSKKAKIQVTWDAPDGFDDDVTFVATVVANYTTYWGGLTSKPTRVVKISSGATQKSGSSIPKRMYDGCGTRKNCLGSPIGCENKRNCSALIAVSKSGKDFEFEMMAMKSKYIAVGFSEDNKMGGDSVIECAYENHREGFEGVNVYRSWNEPNQKRNVRQDSNSGLTLREGNYVDGNTYCKVHQTSVFNVGEVPYDLKQKSYYLLLAAGAQTSEGMIHFHDVAQEVSLDSRQLSDLSPVMIHDDFYDGCSIEKSCFGYPDGCLSQQNCQAIASIHVQGTTYTFKLKSKSGAFVAIGLSTDDKMGGDSVMECVVEKNSVKVYTSWNKPGEKANTREKVNQGIVKMINSTYSDGIIYCEFTREAVTEVMSTSFNLFEEKYYLLLAAGSSLKEKSVGYHDILFTVSGQQKSLSDVSVLTSQSKLFVRLHGSFMAAAWIGTASIGIILARYFRQTWVESSLCAKDLWFAWHRLLMLLTWCLTLVAFVLIFVDVGGWVSSTPSLIHAIFGCCTTFLCFIQPIGAAFRPHPTARNRPFFNWFHWLIGNAAHICAVLALFFATPVAKAELPGWVDWIFFSYVVLYVVVHILLTFVGCASDSKGSNRVNTFAMKDMNTSRSALNIVDRKLDAPFSGFRKLMLFLHIVGVTAVTAAIIVIICLAPIEAQFSSFQKNIMSM